MDKFRARGTPFEPPLVHKDKAKSGHCGFEFAEPCPACAKFYRRERYGSQSTFNQTEHYNYNNQEP